MAPRGRTRKVGLQRMDAAIDAMTAMGFSHQVVRKTVNRLLKVYAGNEGWVFIEEGSYKLLIETLLEEQETEKCRETDQSMEDQSLQDETIVEAELPIAGPSCSISGPSCSDRQDIIPASASLPTGEGQEINQPSKRRPQEVENGVRGDIALGESQVTKESDTTSAGNGVGGASEDVTRAITNTNQTLFLPSHQASVSADPNATPSLPLCQDSPSTVGVQRRRPPCYGWFVGSQQPVDEAEIVVLPPLLPLSTKEMTNRRTRTRWDMRI